VILLEPTHQQATLPPKLPQREFIYSSELTHCLLPPPSIYLTCNRDLFRKDRIPRSSQPSTYLRNSELASLGAIVSPRPAPGRRKTHTHSLDTDQHGCLCISTTRSPSSDTPHPSSCNLFAYCESLVAPISILSVEITDHVVHPPNVNAYPRAATSGLPYVNSKSALLLTPPTRFALPIAHCFDRFDS
jgi:hypothetical protein